MPKPQFSLRALLFVAGLFALTAWVSRSFHVRGELDSKDAIEAFLFSCLIGPPTFSAIGAMLGVEFKMGWVGAVVGLFTGTFFAIALANALH